MHARTILSRAQLSRKLDVDPRTLGRRLAMAGIKPDLRDGSRSFFFAQRLEEIGAAIATQQHTRP